jgi:hypothetical protein
MDAAKKELHRELANSRDTFLLVLANKCDMPDIMSRMWPGSLMYLASAHALTWPYGQSRRSRRAWTWLVWAIPTFCTSARQQPAWVGLSLGIVRVAPGADRYSSFPGVTEALHMLASQLNKIASTAPEKGSVLVD